ncbi:hydroperoxidase II [Sorangium cellulosum]|uniref:Catalase n=1 Tax=Sorangium cellulosum TaxID=56 RepID=A0A2L0ETA9_SORCE|nr:catalase [Sorangium cellulosum]AUX42530.1 hydroperoxidase II [Sorangium cellulosum]
MADQGKTGANRDTEASLKIESLEPHRVDPRDATLSTEQGVRVDSTDDSLRAGSRGPTLLEDFHLREKMTHFDHERIPERVVHARGSAAHGYFQVYESMAEYTRAGFLQDPSVRTPVFVRFSTATGSRGSADTVRDVRGFATKFYTAEGNFDLVGNNIAVFFIQDGIKFPDVIHALKPEPDREIPQASSAHDTFWDFISLTPESTHMILWLLSDRAVPRSFRMMEGFGVHTFRLVNAQGKSRFVKFHWKPLLGVHSLLLEEARRLAGLDPDFHRRDLWDAIERGDYPEYELGVQIIEEEDEHTFDFDLLDATKIVPEELVPVRRIGKMTLNRNPDNFFSETEQSAFHLGNVVPGIDFTADPLLQARLFSYLDTQVHRLGSPNFPQIPINRPLVPVRNQHQEGFMQQRIKVGRAHHYLPNSLAGGCPMVAPPEGGAFVHVPEQIAGVKARARSETFKDHITQARLFWNSLSAPEKRHLAVAARFELGNVASREIRERMVARLGEVDGELGRRVAAGVGVPPPSGGQPPVKGQPVKAAVGRRSVDVSPALSMENTVKDTVRSRRVAVLAADGFAGAELAAVRAALEGAGAHVQVVSTSLGPIVGDDGTAVEAERTLLTAESVLFDAVFVPGGRASVDALSVMGDAVHFVNEAFKHCKAIGATSEGVDLLSSSLLQGVAVAGAQAPGPPQGAAPLLSDKGVVTSRDPAALAAFSDELLRAIARHRHWEREDVAQIPA